MIGADERPGLALVRMVLHISTEGAQRHVLDDLGEDGFARVHAPMTSARGFAVAACAHARASRLQA